MTHDNGLKAQGQWLNTAMRRVLRTAVDMYRPETAVDDIRNDPTAECRWWNGLDQQERHAFVGGAMGSPDYARSDWLDIGETNRMRILDAAYAVQCWLTAVDHKD